MPAFEDLTYGLGLTGADPAALTSALAEAGLRVAAKPGVLAQSLGELALDEGAVALRLARGLLGADGEAAALETGPGDRRFADRAWSQNPFLRSAAESYLVASRWAERTLGGAGLSERKERKARFALRLLLERRRSTPAG